MPPHFSGINDLSLLSSKPFEIIAETGKRFFVHGAILATQLEALRSITAGAERGLEIDLSDWDENTVARFVQFLYFGDYQVPKPTPEEEEGGEEGEEEDCERRDGANTPDTVQSLANQEERRTGDTNALLVHAKVYALAHHKNIESLREMALERLRTALREIDSQMTPRVVLKVIELLGYVDSHMDREEPMQVLVSTFAAENIEKLINRGEMTLLLGNRFAIELVKRMVGRICDTEKSWEKEVQAWKNKSAALGEKMQELEEKLRQLGVSNTERVQELKVTNQKVLEAITAAKTRFSQKIQEGVPASLNAAWSRGYNRQFGDVTGQWSEILLEAERVYSLELQEKNIQG